MYYMQKLVSLFHLKACTLVVLFGLSSEKNQDLNPPLSLVAIVDLSKKKKISTLVSEHLLISADYSYFCFLKFSKFYRLFLWEAVF